jgi:PAS domain S-box-containing protein
MTEPDKSPNDFLPAQPETPLRTSAEHIIELLRNQGGLFVEAVRATRMPMAVTDSTLSGNPIVFANQAMLDVTGYSMEDVLGQQPFFMNGPETDPDDAERFRSALVNGEDIEVESYQYGRDGKRLCLSIFCRALQNDSGQVTNHFLSYLDITRRVDAENEVARRAREMEERVAQGIRELANERAHLRDAEDRFGLIVQGARDYAIFTIDAEGKIADWHKGAETAFGWTREEALGQPFEMTFTPEDRVAGIPQSEKDIAAASGSAPNIRWHVRKDGSRVFIEGNTTSLRTPTGELRGFLKIGQDMTEKRASHRRQETLLLELQHRVRNILAAVRSMAVRTARTSDSVDDYRDRLESRINALARTQAELTKSAGAVLDLQAIVQGELDAHGAQATQFTLNGPKVALAPKAGEVVALAIHELTTNAAKYGALAVASGHVNVSWSVTAVQDEPWLRLSWAERGVRAQPAVRRGFGTELVTGRVPYELKGRGVLRIGEDGAEATIEFPLRHGDSILQTDAARQLQLENPV